MGIDIPDHVKADLDRERREKVVKHAFLGELMPVMIDLTRLLLEIRHLQVKDDVSEPYVDPEIIEKISSIVRLFFNTYSSFVQGYINDIDGLVHSALERMMYEAASGMRPQGTRIPRD